MIQNILKNIYVALVFDVANVSPASSGITSKYVCLYEYSIFTLACVWRSTR